jgi:hypothetical protein
MEHFVPSGPVAYCSVTLVLKLMSPELHDAPHTLFTTWPLLHAWTWSLPLQGHTFRHHNPGRYSLVCSVQLEFGCLLPGLTILRTRPMVSPTSTESTPGAAAVRYLISQHVTVLHAHVTPKSCIVAVMCVAQVEKYK